MSKLKFLVLACLASAIAVCAQTTDTVRTVLKEGVVVRAIQASESAPISKTTIDSAKVQRVMMGQDAQYVLELTSPSIVAYSESGTNVSNYGSFRLRGMDQTRVNVTWNGVPLNDMIDQGVFFSNITDIMNGVHAVQVQRGVGTSSNGTSSFAGSVNIESGQISRVRPAAHIQLSGGSFGLFRGSAEATTGRISNNTAVSAKFTTFSTDGYRYNTGTKSYSAAASFAFYSENDIFKYSFIGGNTKNQLGYYAVPKPLYNADRRTNINDSTDHDDFGQAAMVAEWSHAFAEQTQSSVGLYYGHAGGDYFSGFRDTAGALTQINYPLTNNHIGLFATLDAKDVVTDLDLTVGIHAYSFRRHNWEYVSPNSNDHYYDDHTYKNEISGFVKGRYNIGSAHVFADVQVRHVRMTLEPDERYIPMTNGAFLYTWTFVNPRIGLTYDVADNLDVYASFGYAGREPTRFDLLGSTQINMGNFEPLFLKTTVRPEYVADFEAGVRYRSEHASATLNVFNMSFTDEIAPIGKYIDQQFVQLRKNMPSSRRSGVELEGGVDILDELRMDVNATYMNARIAEYVPENLGIDTVFTNVQPVLTPAFMGSITFIYKPIDELDLQVNGRYVGKSFLELTNGSPALYDQDLTLSGFALLNARIAWRFARQHHIVFTANNILGAEYATNGATTFYEGTTVASLFAQAKRNFGILLDLAL